VPLAAVNEDQVQITGFGRIKNRRLREHGAAASSG